MPHEKMPELPEEIKNIPRKPVYSVRERDAIEAGMKRAGRKVLGSGAEATVEVMQGDDAKVAAHSFLEKEPEFRRAYYVHRILHVLFPKHFPRFFAAFEHGEGRRGGTIRERVPEGRRGLWLPEESKKSFPFVERELASMGIASLFDYGSDENYRAGEEGYEQYLDSVPYFDQKFIEHREKVISYMRSHNYAEADITTVENALGRLAFLQQEQGVEYKKAA